MTLTLGGYLHMEFDILQTLILLVMFRRFSGLSYIFADFGGVKPAKHAPQNPVPPWSWAPSYQTNRAH
jgi:hypothetical protein